MHGFQIKWALEFPDAPLGAIEHIVAYVIKKLGDAGVRSATFGAGAASKLQGVDNVGGFRIKTLEKTYNGLSSTFHLTSKGDFRGKFGIEQEPMYICYPKGSLGGWFLSMFLTLRADGYLCCRCARHRSNHDRSPETQVDFVCSRHAFHFLHTRFHKDGPFTRLRTVIASYSFHAHATFTPPPTLSLLL